jgi:hypothetical protein
MAELAAASATPGIRVSITSKGFAANDTPIDDPKLVTFAQRFRKLGLVGLTVNSQPTAAQITTLVIALGELQRDQATAEVAVQRIADASDGKITAIPLRLGGLRFVEKTADGGKQADSTPIWRDLFAQACGNGFGKVNAAELAKSFESALGPSPSNEHWDEVAGAWARELALAWTPDGPIEAPPEVAGAASQFVDSLLASAQRAADAEQTATGAGTGTGAGAGSSGANAGPARLDAASSFLNALSPHLSKRLLSEAFAGPLVPEGMVLALAQRLPATIVLGALTAVDRNNGEPSPAALALLRKMAAQVGEQKLDPPPRSNQELAETAATLKSLLQTKKEAAFVPEEYLRRRQELSRSAVASEGDAFACPGDRQTSRHAAELVFQMIASSEADSHHAASGLAFLAHRLIDWIRRGEFGQASASLALARGLSVHEDPTRAAAARVLLTTPITPDDLLEGAKYLPDKPAAVDAIARLLRECEGDKFAALLSFYDIRGNDPGDNVVLDAIRKVLTSAPEHCVRGLVGAAGDKPPVALLAILMKLNDADTIRAVTALVPHCGPDVRRAVLQQVFRRNIPWPLGLTERLLEDDEPAVRRFAVMRLVRDNDPATAASYLVSATRDNRIPIDVCFGLDDLLYDLRSNPDVRAARRKWFWSSRRWRALFSFNMGERRRAG